MALIDTIRSIIKDEIANLRFQELGIVTSIFPHVEEDDKDNYEVNVKLKSSGIELRKVPVATDHIGMVTIPNVGDMVLVSYIEGGLQQPVVTGRVYDETNRPPLGDEKEFIIEAPYGEATSFKINKDKDIVLTTGETSITLKADSHIEMKAKENINLQVEGDAAIAVKGDVILETDGDATVKAGGDVTIECANAVIKASGTIDLGENGGAVITDMTHKCFITGAPPVGSMNVKAKS